MKKFIASLFVSTVALCGVSLAATIPVTDLSGPTSCNSNETDNINYYLTTSNSLSRKPYDVFGNTVDSLVGGGSNGSSINIWKHGVISSCNTWNRISNVVSADDTNGALIFLNADNCVFNIPNYTKVSNPTAIDAQIHYTIGYRLIYNGGANTMTTRLYHRDYGTDNWTCYPAGNTVSNSDNCSQVTVKYGSQKYHTGECLNYRVFRCGDGLVNSPYGTTYDNGSHVEQCDPNDPTHAGRGNGGCSASCQPINNTQPPVCNTAYSGTHYVNNPAYPNWLNAGMNLCSIGTVSNLTNRWNGYGHVGHYSWTCSNSAGSVNCQANQQRCGDGLVNGNEACDPNDTTHAGWNGNGYTCNSQCQLVPPQIQAPQCSSTYNNQTQYTPNGNNWLNQNMNLCTIGSVTNFQFSWNPGHSRHFTWNCNNDGQSTGCLAYQQWCGDGKVESNHGEACDPADPTQAGRGNGGCSDYCQPVNVENPQCNSTYNGHTQYTPNSNLWLNNTMNLCTIGTLSNFSYSGTPRHFTWNCSAGGNTINCSANQQWCGDSQVNGSEQCDYNDPNHIGRGDGGCSHSCQPINNPTQPILTIDKQLLTTGNLVAGDYVAYKITLKNIGLGVAHNAYIVDILPLAIHYVSSNIQGVSNYLFDQWVDTNGQDNFKYYNFDLNPNQTATVYLTGVLRQGYSYEELTNCAYTSGAVDCVIIDMNPEPYLLKEQKTGGMTNFTTSTVNTQIGETITYKVNFQNVGSAPATGQVRDILPPCVKYVSSSIHGVNGAQGPTLSQQGVQDVVMYKNFKLNPGQAGYMLVVAEVKGNGVLGVNCSNITSYSNTGYFKFIGGNTLSSSVLAIRPENASSNVIFDKTGNKSIMYPGETGLEFYITVTNQGPNSISNIYVDDIRPGNESCIIYDGWTGTKIEEVSHLRRHYVGGSSNGSNGRGGSVGGRTNQNNGGNNAQSSQLSNGILYAGQSFNFTIFAHIANNPSCVGSYINTGKLTYTEGGSTHVLYDNYPFKVVATPNIKVSITKTVDKTYVHHGDTVTYTITYTNNGTAPLTNYVVRDYWPAMVEFLSSTPATNDIVATNEGTTITWHFNTPLAAGASATITAIGKVR